jgi:hypothetical protein
LLPPLRDMPGIVAVAGCAPDQLPLHPRLHALGSVADVSDLLQTVDFVINTNRFSLFDLSLIEATHAAKPLLLHATGGNRTFAALGAGCRLIDDLQPKTVASGLTEFFVNGSTREAMGERSRDCWLRSLTPRHLRDRHINLYDVFAGYVAARPA